MIEYKTLEEISLPSGIRYGVVQPGKNQSDGVPMLNSGDLSNGIVKSQPNFYVAKEISDKHKKSILKGGELLITLVGTPGITAIAPNSLVGCNVSRAIGVVDLILEVCANYVMYALQTPQAQHQIKVRLNTTVQPTFNLSELKNIKIPLPELSEQTSISQILSTIDEKMESNRKMNITLEDIAKAIFKSWFVDFDPVRAKIEGRPTGLPPEIDELFPDELVDSEIGEIPKGWEATTLGEVTSVIGRGVTPKYSDEGTTIINQKCIRNWSINSTLARSTSFEKTYKQDKYLQEYDCLINSTGVGTLGRVAMCDTRHSGMLCDSHVSIVRGTTPEISIYASMCLSLMESEIENLGHGSTGQTELSRSAIGDIEVTMPSSQLLNETRLMLAPFIDRRKVLDLENETLAELRDTLLPKLISGELRIPDAEKFLEEAGI